MILQDAINHSDFKWRKVLWDFIDELREVLVNGSPSYQQSFIKLAHLFKEQGICEPSTA